jgi:hypothetical protein
MLRFSILSILSVLNGACSLDLWERSWRFDSAHDFEHVEDCLINKRVVYGDEWSQLWYQLGDGD